MLCEVASWIPDAVAVTLRHDRVAPPVIAWLTNIRDSIEEYDTLVTVRSPTPESEQSDSSSTSPDSAFDEILSQLGKEIFKLDEYQRNLEPIKKDVSLSILNIFDKCLEGMTETECDDKRDNLEMINEVNAVNGIGESDVESTLSEISFVTSTPANSDRANSNINTMFDKGNGIPIPPRRVRLKTPSSASPSYDNTELKTENTIMEVAKRLNSDTDSESTCWSYKECSTDGENDEGNPKDTYAAVWSHSSGYHNSDKILRRVLSQHHATVSRLSFDSVNEFAPTQYSVYTLHEVGDRCDVPVAIMTPDKPTDDGYEPVRDAITTDENIYEEIEYGYSYTDEGFSCGGSVEVESCSISASSEGVGRDSPLYANLRDHDAYAISADVIYWKNLLLHPYYNDDEEDEVSFNLKLKHCLTIRS